MLSSNFLAIKLQAVAELEGVQPSLKLQIKASHFQLSSITMRGKVSDGSSVIT
jgi:hypothetical protein